MARHGYDAICAHNLFAVYHIDKVSTGNRALCYDGKMCDCTKISYEKCDDVDFDTSINHDMCIKVMFIFIYIKLHIVDKYIYLYQVYCYLHHLCA